VKEIARLSGTNKPITTENARIRPAASEVRALLADNTKLLKATGWKPAHSLEEGLQKTIEWWRRRLRDGVARKDTSYLT
jgi:UDP-glucose 4-epimerase